MQQIDTHGLLLTGASQINNLQFYLVNQVEISDFMVASFFWERRFWEICFENISCSITRNLPEKLLEKY